VDWFLFPSSLVQLPSLIFIPPFLVIVSDKFKSLVYQDPVFWHRSLVSDPPILFPGFSRCILAHSFSLHFQDTFTTTIAGPRFPHSAFRSPFTGNGIRPPHGSVFAPISGCPYKSTVSGSHFPLLDSLAFLFQPHSLPAAACPRAHIRDSVCIPAPTQAGSRLTACDWLPAHAYLTTPESLHLWLAWAWLQANASLHPPTSPCLRSLTDEDCTCLIKCKCLDLPGSACTSRARMLAQLFASDCASLPTRPCLRLPKSAWLRGSDCDIDGPRLPVPAAARACLPMAEFPCRRLRMPGPSRAWLPARACLHTCETAC
jgi:hypothetical protein